MKRKSPLQNFEIGQQERAPRSPNKTRGRSIKRDLQRQSRSTTSKKSAPQGKQEGKQGTTRRSGNRHSSR